MRSYLRPDGLIYVIADSGQVYEMRRISLKAETFDEAARDGYLTPLGPAPCLDPLPCEPPPRGSRVRWRAGLRLA